MLGAGGERRSDSGLPVQPAIRMERAAVFPPTMRSSVRAGGPAVLHAAADNRAPDDGAGRHPPLIDSGH
ncbi:hypothetical protein AWB96_16730 [Mycobacteroides chelonae]|nr:hypothetical protein GR01_06650 [Mycobacteroides chelonae]ANB00823.1 hypothetical protein BB28_07105 [Mycobacteroides chelonae CCUG 47445]OLT75332.1 hypothetical protein BKG56_16485 [Mycobacteroides chelonae]ORV12991.1 hypothetical protein AWB96_16730 [Mycobacteroides chelonae]